MKTFLLVVFLFIFTHSLIAQNKEYFSGSNDSFFFDINRIKLPINSNGIIGDVTISPFFGGGLYDDIVFLFSGGFFLSGYTGDSLWANAVASASRIEDYQPGNVNSDPENPLNKIYVVKSSDTPFGESWQNWSDAVQLGADFYDGNNDSVYNPVDLNGNGVWDLNEDRPDLLGDLTAWCVFNDGVPDSLRRFSDVSPQGIEIHQTIFGNYPSNNQIENIVYIRYRLINKGTVSVQLDSVYFGTWSDPDLGDYTDDLIGSDTLLNSVYCYNNGDDAEYGINPPAFFQQFIQGPVSYIPGVTFIDNNSNGTYEHGIDTPLDSAKQNHGLFLGSEILPGAKNLNLSSAIHLISSHPTQGDPSNKTEARNYMIGTDKFGEPLDPCTWSFGLVHNENCSNVNPVYIFSGNPVDNVGWINIVGTDQRMMGNTGPFTLKENEPVDIIAAYVMGRGTDHLNSITKARQNAEYALAYYNSNFTFLPPVGVEDEVSLAKEFKLFQNYPNPFNPTTKIQFRIAEFGLVKLKIYDILGREVTTLINEFKSPGEYTVEFNGSRFASGVYFYELKTGDFIQRKKMILIK